MTDYELVNLFQLHLTNVQTAVMNYVALLFAFLIAAYLIADKLESSMVFIVVGLFTLVVLQQTGPIIGTGYDFAAIAGQIATRAADDPTGLGWHGTATPFGATAVAVTRFTAGAVMFVSYIGGVFFFFHQRRVGRKQSPEVTQ